MLTTIEKIDLFLRFATVGQICLLATLLVVRRPLTARALLAILSALCLVAYLLLTAPVDFFAARHRGIVMSLVHSLPFFVWALIADIFSVRTGLLGRPVILGGAILTVLVLNFIVFWVADAPQALHQASHWIALALLAHLLFLAVHGKSDDLLPERRRLRAWFLAFFVAQFALIILVEITGFGFGDPQVTNAINVAFLFLIVLVLGVTMAGSAVPILIAVDEVDVASRAAPADVSIDSKDRALYERLQTFMNEGGYSTAGLNVRLLGNRLAAPEHQLRRLINQGLGYRNFSTFLNTYRIEAACRRLENPAEAHIPVLTIAMDLGYGSIGPFNRAFKSITGKTPSEYRQFRNRP